MEFREILLLGQYNNNHISKVVPKLYRAAHRPAFSLCTNFLQAAPALGQCNLYDRGVPNAPVDAILLSNPLLILVTINDNKLFWIEHLLIVI